MPTHDELDTRLRDEGAFPGLPRRDGLIDGPTLDAQICAESPCSACGHVGMGCTVYTDTSGAYRAAIADCPACSEAFEF